MLTPRIDLAYVDSLSICLAVENHQPCLNGPRWIEESWSAQEVNELKRARDELDESWDEIDLETKRSKARKLIAGQVCHDHQSRRHTERLYTNMMIRRFACGDLTLEEPGIGDHSRRESTNLQQTATQLNNSERSPEAGRRGPAPIEEGMTPNHDESLFPPGKSICTLFSRQLLVIFPDSPPATTTASSFRNGAATPNVDPLWPETPDPSPQTDGPISATSPAFEADYGSSQPAAEEQFNLESNADSSNASVGPSDYYRSEMQSIGHDTALERLMFRSVLRDREDQIRHLEHQVFMSQLEKAYWRDQHDRLAAHVLNQASESVAFVAANGR